MSFEEPGSKTVAADPESEPDYKLQKRRKRNQASAKNVKNGLAADEDAPEEGDALSQAEGPMLLNTRPILPASLKHRDFSGERA